MKKQTPLRKYLATEKAWRKFKKNMELEGKDAEKFVEENPDLTDLRTAFNWSKTEEGYYFWSKLYYKALKREQKEMLRNK